MTREDIWSLLVGEEMDVTVGYHVIGLRTHPSLYPEYSTDIAAAWEVNKKMMSYLFSTRMRYFELIQESVSRRKLFDGEIISYPDILMFIEPEDFCRAALLAVYDA